MSAAGFDAAGFVADLRAIGLTVGIVRDVPRGGEVAGPPTYYVRAPARQGLGSQSGYDDVMDRWRAAIGERADYRQAVVAYLAKERPATFDPVTFVSDLQAAGCVVVLSRPGTVFKPDDEAATYFIRPGPGHCGVMEKWGPAIVACPDHVERVTALLVGRSEAGV